MKHVWLIVSLLLVGTLPFLGGCHSTRKKPNKPPEVTADAKGKPGEPAPTLATLEERLSQQAATIEQLQATVVELKGRLSEAEVELALHTTKLAGLGKAAPVPGTAASGPTTGAAANLPALEGKVERVNSELGFVIVNLGEGHGVRVGVEGVVRRGEQVVCRVRVQKVYVKYVVADLLPDGAGQPQKDDVVRFLSVPAKPE